MNDQEIRQPQNRHLWIRLVLALIILAGLTTVLSRRMGDTPELGPLLSPYEGLWSHSSSVFEAGGAPARLRIPGLKGRVQVVVDSDQIKHVFAENDEDLYLAQGYLVASDRLWQMEFLSRLAAGRLSEILGPRTLEYDRFFLKMGIPQAAKESLEVMMQDDLTSFALKAYVRGVNAYVASLTPKTIPFEYKLLGHRPEEWTPLKAALLMKLLAYDLSGHSYDPALERSRMRLEPQDFNDLFPLDLSIPEPIVPKGTKWNFASRAPEAPAIDFRPDPRKLEPYPTPHPNNGSNNWAVTGRKSATGLPIISNDIHLELHLPSIWYEIQLVSPTQNVYGATLPGSPGVILGFNKSLAWAVTNGGTDVLDWYELRYRDEKKAEYLYDGDFRPVISNEVEIKVRGGKPVPLVLRRTHIGPIVYEDQEAPVSPSIPRGLVMRWAALDASNELKTFLKLNHSSTTEECHEAILTFQTPDQNFLCADNRDDVGLWHNGRYPIRWKGQGRLILDGSTSASDWQGWLPREEIPFYRNPERGFLSSANQAPTDQNYPHYLGWPFEDPYRGQRINELLRAKDKFQPKDFVAMQTDTLSIPARELVPVLIEAVSGMELTDREARAIEELKKWDYRFEEESVGGAIFDGWFAKLNQRLWYPRLGDEAMYPPLIRTIKLIREEPQAKWFDDPTTPEVETLKEQVRRALAEAVAELTKREGRDVSDWKWATVRPTELSHVGHVPGLGEKLKARGQEQAVFANMGNHGPVWKLVVALGPKPRAWALYPGGQSGDPASRYYTNFLEDWRKGEMHEVNYLTKPTDPNPRQMRLWHLEKP